MLHFLLVPALTGALAFTAAGSDPVTYSAEDLYANCRDGAFAPSQMACKFFIFGVVQAMRFQINDQGLAQENKHFCVPDDVTSDEMRLVFMRVTKWDFEHYADDKKSPAVAAVVAAMLTQYPCKK